MPCIDKKTEKRTAQAESGELQMAQPKTWAYGLTTVPKRREIVLPQTLASLKAAGFGEPVLFVDGIDHNDAISYEREFNLPVVNRWPKVLTFGNWILGLGELYVRNPLCTYYAMFQDDFVCSSNLRAYLDRVQYPDGSENASNYGYKKPGYWNLFTFDINRTRLPRDLNEEGGRKKGWFASTQQGLGAVALVFDRATVWDLLTERGHIITRPAHAGERRWKNIDGGIVDALKKQGRLEYVHNPSLVQHTGLRSTMGSGRHPSAGTFRGESFDCLSLLPS